MALFHLPIAALCLLGLFISAYAYSVEQRIAEAKRYGMTYKAYCDIGPFSCTRILSSEYGSAIQFLGLPKISNAALGTSFYAVEMVFAWSPTITMLLSMQSVVASVVLGYILFVIHSDVCLLCCSIYVINVATAILAFRWWRARTNSSTDHRKRH